MIDDEFNERVQELMQSDSRKSGHTRTATERDKAWASRQRVTPPAPNPDDMALDDEDGA